MNRWKAVVAVLALAWFGAAAPAGATQMTVAGGSSWRVEPTVTSPARYDVALSGVSCVSTTYCVAVGYSAGDSFSVSETWDGRSWGDISQVDTGAGTGLAAIACPGADDCFAVGSTIEHLAQGHWSTQAAPSQGTGSELSDVACAGRSFCVAVGYAYHGTQPYAVIDSWNGRVWSAEPAAKVAGAMLLAVACPSTDTCVADGSHVVGHGSKPLTERWTGQSWKAAFPPAVTSGKEDELTGIACPGVHACEAVGTWSPGSSAQGVHPLVDRYAGGRWQRMEVPVPSGEAVSLAGLTSVSCPSATDCYAVGSYGPNGDYKILAEHWNGKAWTFQSVTNVGDASELSAVSCVRNRCRAVGDSLSSQHVYSSLAEVN